MLSYASTAKPPRASYLAYCRINPSLTPDMPGAITIGEGFARPSSAQGAGLADPRRAIGTPPRLYQLQSRSHRARCSDRMAVVWLCVTGLAARSRSRRLGGLRRRPEGARVQPVGVKVEHAAVKFAGVARLTAEKVEIFYVLPSFGDDPRLVVGAGRFVAGNNCRRPQGRDLVWRRNPA